jgi:hypothetical protein
MSRQSLENTNRLRLDEMSSASDSAILDARLVRDALNEDPEERLRSLGAAVGIRNAVLFSAAIWATLIILLNLLS